MQKGNKNKLANFLFQRFASMFIRHYQLIYMV